jgi:hypothetical protein
MALIRFRKYDDDEAFYVENLSDRDGDQLDAHPAIRELQEASRRTILAAVKKPFNLVAKVARGTGFVSLVSGYMTLARFLDGATPDALERMLGFRAGTLRPGCRVYIVDVSCVTADEIGPRYTSAWSAGVSPRQLALLSTAADTEVGYHRGYPPATDPIPQFTIFRKCHVLSSQVLRNGERFGIGTS